MESLRRSVMFPMLSVVASCHHQMPLPEMQHHEIHRQEVVQSLDCKSFIDGVNIEDPVQPGDDLQGGTSFQTAVCGYANVHNETLTADDMDGPEIGTEELAYVDLVITDFRNDLFHRLLVCDELDGNSLITLGDDGDVALAIGCLDDNGSVAMVERSQVLLDATEQNPVPVLLTFTEHSGGGFYCASLADGVEVLDIK